MATAPERARTLVSRAVIWTGIVLGTAVTILAMGNGARLRVPDIPPVLSAALGALILWVLVMAVAAALSELTVRHHRAALRYGWRYSKRGGQAAGRHARRAWRSGAAWSLPWRKRILAYLGSRWTARGTGPPWWREAPPPDIPAAAAGPSTTSPADPGAGRRPNPNRQMEVLLPCPST